MDITNYNCQYNRNTYIHILLYINIHIESEKRN